MNQEKIIIRPQDTKAVRLPGTVSLPDGKKPIKLGSGIISSLISSGGMAIVYEIWNEELEVRRAVKLLKPDHSLESEERFHTEMKITARLHHPNIVEIYTVGAWSNLPYIEMELIEGITLEKLAEESGGLPPEVCTSVAIMVGRALNYAHNQTYVLYGKRFQGVIHRDIKPGNIMVTKDGVAKLMDFGIAKPMTASSYTLEGTVMGTMQYLAPEQLDGKEVDVRADLYSLGTVMYEMLTGARAFPEEKLGKLVTDKLSNSYVPLTEYDAGIPASLCNLVHHCIRYDKEKRIQNSIEFLRAVCRIHKTLTLKAPEQVLEHFMANRGGQKHVVRTRKRSVVVPAIVWSVTGCAFAAIALFTGIHVKDPATARRIVAEINAVTRQALQKVLPGLHNRLFAEPRDEGALVDSVLARQRPLRVAQEPSAEADVLDSMVRNETAQQTASAAKKGGSVAEASTEKIRTTPAPTAGKYVSKGNAPEGASGPLPGVLKRQLHGSDATTLFSSEIEAGHFANGLALYKMLPAGIADSKKALLYKLRALRGVGDKSGERYFLIANDVRDGEFYLEKAHWYYDAGDYASATRFVERASVSPVEFLDSRVFRERLLYAKALCASAAYNANPGEDSKKTAMEAWFDVKTLFRTSPESVYFVKADSEIRRISANLLTKH